MNTQKKLLASVIASLLASGTNAQESTSDNNNVEVIEVRGIVSSLKRAMSDKKESIAVSDGIAAEDLGKFPDLNVAESLQRITGVSIDRSGGEGQQVTVRGLGPQFNSVLVNGRQIANDSQGREFNFDVIAAEQITGAKVFKSTQAQYQAGGIGATIDITTARPFSYDGFKAALSAKAQYETLSEETSPTISGLVSNTFADGKFGALLALSHSEREMQINSIRTAGWRPGQTLSHITQDSNGNTLFEEDGVTPQTTIVASNVYFPRNWDQEVDQQNRERTNASLVLQFAPSEEVTITFDGLHSRFEIDSVVSDLASWFEPGRVGSDAIIDADTRTALFFTQELSDNPATDFVQHTRNQRDTTVNAYALNVEWAVSDQLTSSFDVSISDAENDIAGKDRFNVIGLVNEYSFDGTGATPTVQHAGLGNGNLPDASLARAHYNERGNGFTNEDDIVELKADFEYQSNSDVFQSAKFGIYRQEREKARFREFNNVVGDKIFGGYVVPVPTGTLQPFVANNFFPGLIDTFYAYDGEAHLQYLESAEAQSANDVARGLAAGTSAAVFAAANNGLPILEANRYNIKEDITSLYMDFNFAVDLGDMPLSVNFGARYDETKIDVAGVQADIADIVPGTDLTLFSNVFEEAVDISLGTSYSNLLPSLNLKLEVEEDMILRLSAYDSLTRPTMSQLSPSTVFQQSRSQNLRATGGNPNLKPITSENWDASFEWYYNDASSFTFAVFSKEVENFISVLTGEESYELGDRAATDDFRCNTSNSGACAQDSSANSPIDRVLSNPELNGQFETFVVARPQNTEAATITGYEIAWTHVWDNGFGVTANATVVDSDTDSNTDSSNNFGVEGLGDSQNLILFYENDAFQARIAFNNREAFLRNLQNPFNGEPINGQTFGQWDISASYDINETFTAFFEGINITEEELVQTGRFATQIFSIEDNGSRFALGVRASF